MAKIQQSPELIDIIAAALNFHIVDRVVFQARVNEELVSILAPRLHLTELEQQGIISPKKAPSEARGLPEVTK